MIRLSSLKFWQKAFLLTFVVWLVLTLSDMLSYMYRVHSWGNFIFNEDGSPFTLWQRFISLNFEQFVWLPILLFTFLAEVNYHFIFRRRSTKLFVFGCFIGGVAEGIYFVVADGLKYGLFGGISGTLPIIAVMPPLFLVYALIRDYIHRRLHTAEYQLQQSKAELNTLKAQVNPHFFFNTLNSLYGTALEENATRTADSIDQLSGIMRYTMNEAREEYTDIKNELKFLEDYLHLQRLRLPDRKNIEVKTEINYDGKPCTIAPLLLIPFIENAFKYGISMDQECWVHICLTIKDKQLNLLVSNRILKESHHLQSLGTGIENTRRRLSLLYPTKHKLTLTKEDVFHVHLSIDLSPAWQKTL